MFDKKIIFSVLLALVIFEVVRKVALDKLMDKIPHYEEMLEQ